MFLGTSVDCLITVKVTVFLFTREQWTVILIKNVIGVKVLLTFCTAGWVNYAEFFIF